MGELIDAPFPGPLRVTLANRKKHERGLRGFLVDAEYSSPLTIRLRNVVLDASAETRAVACFRLAKAQGLNRDTPGLQLANRWLDCRSRRLAGTLEILSENLLVHA